MGRQRKKPTRSPKQKAALETLLKQQAGDRKRKLAANVMSSEEGRGTDLPLKRRNASRFFAMQRWLAWPQALSPTVTEEVSLLPDGAEDEVRSAVGWLADFCLTATKHVVTRVVHAIHDPHRTMRWCHGNKRLCVVERDPALVERRRE